jgi:hypothetical protein
MKSLLMFISLALFANGAHAENESIEFSFKTENSTMSETVEMGLPTPLQNNNNAISASCSFKSDLAGTPKAEYNVVHSAGLNTMVLPVERTETGIKAYITISTQSVKVQEWAVISHDCKLPVGQTGAAGISMMDTFKWGEPAAIKLSDGSVVVVTANKIREAGINYKK